MIIGGGVAGLEAAGRLLELGHMPIVVEKSDHLGGHVAGWHRIFPDMTPAREIVSSLVEGARDASIFLETDVRSLERQKNRYEIVLSNGVSVSCRAVLVASGFELFDARKKEEYGYGIYNRVITNSDLERWFSTGDDQRIPESPRSIGFVHCVGSRDVKAGNSQCSKVCCMTAVKQAMEMKAKFPQAEIYCFYMDLRLFGKKYEDFYINAQKDCGVHFIRGRVSEVGETFDGRVQVKAEDTLNGKPLKASFDLLVLMSGMVCGGDTASIASSARLPVDSDGFFQSRDNIYGLTESLRPGIFFAGACTGSKTVPETVAEARAAALGIHRYLCK